MNLQTRKPTRLKQFDYSQNGYYFITICTKDKQKLFGNIVGDGACDIPKIKLSHIGKIADKYIQVMNSKYNNTLVDKYVIMPNHIHLIIKITNTINTDNILNGMSQAPSPTNAIIPKFVSLYKRYCNRECNKNIFQRSFHDHIIRGEKDYLKIWNYIDTNPQKWQQDCFFTE
jgi:REP element-mobilizing transposase RayT